MPQLEGGFPGHEGPEKEAPPGFEPGNKGFAGLCLTAWLRRQKRGATRLERRAHPSSKAGNRTRTGDPHLGKVVLYQLSYSRKKKGVSDPYPNLHKTFPKHPSIVR